MSMNPLDLTGHIRPGLDILGNEIVIALKKRTRFSQNQALYLPGLVAEHPERSVLDHTLSRIEATHAELGRYRYAAQESFSDADLIEPIIQRRAPITPVLPMRSQTGERIRTFWQDWITVACAPGEDPDRYGETVTADVNALLCMMERVNLGKLVAEAKFREQRERVLSSGGEEQALRDIIVREDREREVMALAARLARHYDLPESLADVTFRFLIDATVQLEIEYLRERIHHNDWA